eukprot:scpid91437/ scgid24577/ 
MVVLPSLLEATQSGKHPSVNVFYFYIPYITAHMSQPTRHSTHFTAHTAQPTLHSPHVTAHTSQHTCHSTHGTAFVLSHRDFGAFTVCLHDDDCLLHPSPCLSGANDETNRFVSGHFSAARWPIDGM